MPARAWVGYATRWAGQGAAPIDPIEAVIVGHDACDGGGMRGCSNPVRTAPVGSFPIFTLTSSLGFCVWTVDVSPYGGLVGSAITLALSVVATDPEPGGPSLDAIGWLYGGPRDVVARTLVRPDAEQPPAPLILSLATSAGIPSFVTFARPLVVPPLYHLLLWVDGAGAPQSIYQTAVLFEEGL